MKYIVKLIEAALAIAVIGFVLLGLVITVWEFLYAQFTPYEAQVDKFYQQNNEQCISAVRSDDPIRRAEYAVFLSKESRNAILFVPCLIELLNDHTPLQVVSGPPVATKALGNVVGNTTPGAAAYRALEKITGNDLGKDPDKWQKWWDSWWAENKHRFKENPKP